MKVLEKSFFIFSIFCLLLTPWSPSLSLKQVSSWVFNHKEETFYQEHSLENTATVVIKQTTGSITIKTWLQPKLVIEATKIGKEKDINKFMVETTLTPDHALIQTHYKEVVSGNIDYVIMMPQQATLIIEAENSDIVVKQLEGSINIVLQAGLIDIRHANNTVYAKNEHGPITLSSKRLVEPHFISLEAGNSIMLSIPLTIHANLQAKAPQGTVESEHLVTIKPFKAKLNQHTWNQCKKEVSGTLGDGGPKIKLYARSGSIKLIEY